MENLLHVVQTVNSYLSDYVLIVLLVLTGLYFSIRTKFVQVRCFCEGWRTMFSRFSLNGKGSGKGLSSFQALTAAVAAQVGTGNIVGASGAILVGGPGAIFWMWIIAFLGMSTIYAEAILAQKTRVVNSDGTISGGPVHYIHHAFPNVFGKVLAVFFAISAIIALGFVGLTVQANSIGETCNSAFHFPQWGTMIFLVVFSFLIFIGGVSRLGAVTEKIVPFMAVLYLIGGLIILACRITYIPQTFGLIFRYAFHPEALLGGGLGAALKIAISQGVKRGLFSNEAGMGSTPHAHAQAMVSKAHEQGVLAMMGVFLDTFVVLTMTALVVISTIYTGNGPLANIAGNSYSELLTASGLTKTNLVPAAFGSIMGSSIAGWFVAISLFFFAYSTILSWSFFGRINFLYLFGHNRWTELIYSLIGICFIAVGTLMQNDLVWELQDMFDQLIVLPNVIALIALGKIVVDATKE